MAAPELETRVSILEWRANAIERQLAQHAEDIKREVGLKVDSLAAEVSEVKEGQKQNTRWFIGILVALTTNAAIMVTFGLVR